VGLRPVQEDRCVGLDLVFKVLPVAPITMFYVYILRSLKTGGLYVGQTNDIDRRLSEHNEGGVSSFTRNRRPWVLAYKEICPDRTSAVRRERFLKSVQGSREKKHLAGLTPANATST